MRTYQTLSLIGCIIGIFLTLGLALLMGGLMTASDVLLNMSRPTESERQEQAVKQTSNSAFVGGVLIAFFIYIAILVVTFAVRTKTKAVGITIIILGVIGMATTNLWGIIPFALLLPAGISALRYKRELIKPSSDHEE
jgi:formate/nitrite transporter FocA (FNT family)